MKTKTVWEVGDVGKVKVSTDELSGTLYGTVKQLKGDDVVITVPVPTGEGSDRRVGLQDLVVASDAIRQPRYVEHSRDALLRQLTGNYKPPVTKPNVIKLLKQAKETKFKPPESSTGTED